MTNLTIIQKMAKLCVAFGWLLITVDNIHSRGQLRLNINVTPYTLIGASFVAVGVLLFDIERLFREIVWGPE